MKVQADPGRDDPDQMVRLVRGIEALCEGTGADADEIFSQLADMFERQVTFLSLKRRLDIRSKGGAWR